MHRIGCLFVGRGFFRSSKEATTYHPPELGSLEQELLPLACDLLGSGRHDFLAWSVLEQLGMVKRLADAACLTEAELPEDYRVTADLVEQWRHLKSLIPELFVHYLEHFGRV